MELNLMKLGFSFMTLFIVFVGNLVNFFEDHLPAVIARSFRYGKYAYVKTTSVKLIELPKSWFRHFYVFSSLFSFYILYLAVDVYLYNAKVSSSILLLFDILGGSGRSPVVDPLPVLLALTLMSIHCLRRFYETWFVSVFSKGKINLSHYFVGYIHYFGAISAMLVEAKGFSSRSSGVPEIRLAQVSFFQVIGTVIFLYAWYHQFQCAIILANLRKNNKGEVVNTAHKIPRGGLFERVSSPHITCEILIYIGLTLILHQSTTFLYVLFWVLSNQIETAFLSHWWYKKTFPRYPKQRKVVVPYVL